MANKTLIGIVVAIIVIVGGYYIYSGGNVVSDLKGAMGVKPETSATIDDVATTPVPGGTSSNDQIIDYVVDGLSSDAKATTQAAIDGTTAPSQTNVAGSINTNF